MKVRKAKLLNYSHLYSARSCLSLRRIADAVGSREVARNVVDGTDGGNVNSAAETGAYSRGRSLLPQACTLSFVFGWRAIYYLATRVGQVL